MKRLVLVLALLAAAVASPASAPGNGCPLPCSGQSASPPDRKLLFVQPAGEGGPLVAYDTATGRQRFALPAGRASSDGTTFVAARVQRAATVVTRYDSSRGRALRRSILRGRWSLAAVSPTGDWSALRSLSERAGRTRLAILSARSGRLVHELTLRGDFEVETVSRDGKRLFLIQHLRSTGTPRYLVRLYDLTGERLVANPLRAKGEDRVMAGLAWSGIGSPDGRWLLTLYLNTDRSAAFVHALDLDRSTAVCIDLPSSGPLEPLRRYTLTLSPDARTLYAANAALGAVVEIDLSARRVVRTARFAAATSGTGSRTLAGSISSKGRTLYFSDGRDLWAYDSAYGVVRGPYRTGGALVGFGFGQDGRRVHALRADGRMLAFDAATGRRVRS